MMQSTQDAEARRVIEQFIGGVNERDANAVRSLSSSTIHMTFPGGIVMRSVEDFFNWLAGRSPRSTYQYDVIDVVNHQDRTVAYASGRAEGVTVTGVPFAGVRIMDKFVIQDGKVTMKEAWSDMSDFMRHASLGQNKLLDQRR